MEEFTKDMLRSGKHVVVFRNRDKYLYLNGYFVGKTKAGYIKIENGSCDVDQRWYGLNEPMDVIGWMPIK